MSDLATGKSSQQLKGEGCRCNVHTIHRKGNEIDAGLFVHHYFKSKLKKEKTFAWGYHVVHKGSQNEQNDVFGLQSLSKGTTVNTREWTHICETVEEEDDDLAENKMEW